MLIVAPDVLATPFMSFLKTSFTSDEGVNPSLRKRSAIIGCHFSTSFFASSAHAVSSGTSVTSTVTFTATALAFSSPSERDGRRKYVTMRSRHRELRMTTTFAERDRRPHDINCL